MINIFFQITILLLTTQQDLNNFYVKNFENTKIENNIKTFKYPIYMLHSISYSNPKQKWWYGITFSPPKFKLFIKKLKEKKVVFLTFKDFDKIINNKIKAPKKAVILTFDDGYDDIYKNALPVLKKYNAKWVFFIIVNKVWKKWYMNWEEIKTLQKYGNEIWSHSLNHQDLRFLKISQLQKEIVLSKKILENKLNTNIISFCYPAWKYNKKTLNLVKKYYKYGRTTKLWYITKIKNKYTIPQIRVNPNSNIDKLVKYVDFIK